MYTPFDKSGMIVELETIHGQKRNVQAEDYLGLVLVWTCTRGSLNILQLVFGLTYSNLYANLLFGICLIVEVFRNDPFARVSIPPVEVIETYKEV